MFLVLNFFYIFRKSVLKNVLNKINYIKIYKNNSKIDINIYIFFKQLLISEIIQKKERLLVHKNSNFYNKNYIFEDQDWFSHNVPIWKSIFDIENINEKKLEYLEIGSYEGRSILYICENYKKINVTAVDPYADYKEISKFVKKLNMENIYKNFLKNINKFSDRIKLHRSISSDFFKHNTKKFDIIYIDGSHYFSDVMEDFQNSIKTINKGGIIILDDFLWNHYEKIQENPIAGIIPMLKKHPNLKILSVSYQLILKVI